MFIGPSRSLTQSGVHLERSRWSAPGRVGWFEPTTAAGMDELTVVATVAVQSRLRTAIAGHSARCAVHSMLQCDRISGGVGLLTSQEPQCHHLCEPHGGPRSYLRLLPGPDRPAVDLGALTRHRQQRVETLRLILSLLPGAAP